MIKVVFFAQTRELLGIDELSLEPQFDTIDEIRRYLSEKGDKWALALDPARLLSARNQTLSSLESAVQDGDEIAFFPPVTGG